jgi:hypothetical protein
MKGLKPPTEKKDMNWWNEMHECTKTLNDSLYLEKLFYNSQDVILHLVIPTQFGILLNQKRNDTVYKQIKKFTKKLPYEFNHELVYTVFLVQETIMLSCCFCRNLSRKDEKKPYQVVIRFIVALVNNELLHTTLFNIICRKCQTSPWHALYLIDHSMCPFISEKLDELQLSNELDPKKIIGPEYLKRFSMLNCFIPEILILFEKDKCYHCKRHDKNPKLCNKCKCVWFCTERSGDKRFNYQDETCETLSLLYHDEWLCKELEAGYLFHVLDARYIDPNGQLTSAVDFTK